MKSVKLFVSALSLVCATAAGAATTYHDYNVFGNLVSFNAISSGGIVENDVLDPSLPKLEFNGSIVQGNVARLAVDSSGGVGFNISLSPEYYNVSPLNSGLSATFVGFNQSASSSGAGLSYDPVTRHLTGTIASSTHWGVGSWCGLSTSACSAWYSETLSAGTSTLDLYFNSTLEGFTGTVIVDSSLKTGGTIHRVYNVTGVPLPTTGLMFGSAVLALAGARRRKA